MASLKDLRKRIKSVQNTQKITRAMKLVATAKLRRAQEAVEASRPYADRVQGTIAGLAKRVEAVGEAPHGLLEQREGGKCELIVLTSDRGLCGGFNSNTVRRAKRFLFDERDNYDSISVSTIGRKGYESLRKVADIRENYEGLLAAPSFSEAKRIADEVCGKFEAGELDRVFLIFHHFKNAGTQLLTVEQMLPVVPIDTDAELPDVEFEPADQGAFLDALLPQAFATQLYRAILESAASEHGARMTAMDNAASNAADMVDALSIQYNRARQAAITTELMEIIGGAEALK